jgi:hypothetical protein
MNLNQAIERLQTLCRQGDARALQKEMFASDASLCGEGSPGITVGADLLPALTEMLKITPQLSIRSVRTVELSADAAVTWLEWTSPTADGKPGETITIRSLAAWKKQGAAWVIAADMYGMGGYSAT